MEKFNSFDDRQDKSTTEFVDSDFESEFDPPLWFLLVIALAIVAICWILVF